MYCKVLNNQKILDVICQPKFVIRNEIGIFEEVGLSKANGVRSSDGLKVWNLEGRQRILKNAPTVRIIEINLDEYNVLLEMLTNSRESQELEEAESPQRTSLFGDQMALDAMRSYKIKRMSEECNNAIVKGVFVVLSDELVHHFELQVEDQINLLSLQSLIDQGTDSVVYHEKDKPCQFYSKEDILKIIALANNHKTYHTTYFNALKGYINTIEDLNLISAVYYGMDIPKEYQTEALKSLLK